MLKKMLGLLLILGLLGAGSAWLVYSAHRPAHLPLVVVIPPNQGVRDIAHTLAAADAIHSELGFALMAKASGQANQLKAGTYRFESPLSMWAVMQKMARGEVWVNEATLTIQEGLTFRQFRAALNRHPDLRHDTQALSDAEILQLLGAPFTQAEGWFFPDTYAFRRGSSDVDVLRLAFNKMQKELLSAWETRMADTPLTEPYQALILASIIEKETGRAADRQLVSSVFNNRLRIGMPLQTDPTVIYGLGEAFDGNLRKNDLRTDTPWNTYTRPGLPPTPIAMPGKASLLAAVQPVPSKALYFVARGDGSSEFSATLDAHNRAVNQYQRGGGAKKP